MMIEGANLFFERISQRATVKPDDLLKDPELIALIEPIVLQKIYQYILDNKEQIQKELFTHKAFRLPKEISGLSRTINIIQGDESEWILLLETKRKLASGMKDENRPVYFGHFKVGKDAWRIDCLSPEKWANMRVESAKPKGLNGDVEEAKYSQQFSSLLFNRSFLGARFHKKGKWKQSLYSPKAIDSLDKMDIRIFTQTDRDRIAKGILEGIAIIHSRNEIFQDIKPPNVFIYKDEYGYYAKLSDFGACTGVRQDLIAQANLRYESPEISFAYRDPNELSEDIRYICNYYQDEKFASYGRAVSKLLYPCATKDLAENKALAITYSEPHAKNDMWAAGILLYRLYTGKRLMHIDAESEAIIMRHPLLKGLLEPERDKRLTAQGALDLLRAEPVVISAPKCN